MAIAIWKTFGVLGLMMSGSAMDADASAPKRPQIRSVAQYAPVGFADVPGWSADVHVAAFATFQKSCERLIVLARTDSKVKPSEGLLAICVRAAQLSGLRSDAEARAFFEQSFVPHRVVHEAGKGLLTAYYEPLVLGSRTPTARFSWPLYKRPSELVNIVDESQRGAIPGGLTHARQTDKGVVPFATRAEIEQGALKGRNLELLYVEHAVDAFFMQIQGSARVKLTDGTTIRVGYDGKNGHPYTSIGRVLIDQGQIPVERMSLQALAGWLKANAAKAREVMWANKSFVFFKEHGQKEASGPQGVHDITLTPGRSLAVDPSYHALGSPVYVTAPEIKHIPAAAAGNPGGSLRKSAAAGKEAAVVGFHRLMIAQDVGSAIKGPERGDIYVGSGDAAGKIAGITKHPGNFFVLLPRGETAKRPPAGVAAPAGAVAGKPPISSAPASPALASPALASPVPATAIAPPMPTETAPAETGAVSPPVFPAAGATISHNPQANETIASKPVPEKDAAPKPEVPAAKAAPVGEDQLRTSLQ